MSRISATIFWKRSAGRWRRCFVCFRRRCLKEAFLEVALPANRLVFCGLSMVCYTLQQVYII